jgi:hypothetical protein
MSCLCFELVLKRNYGNKGHGDVHKRRALDPRVSEELTAEEKSGRQLPYVQPTPIAPQVPDETTNLPVEVAAEVEVELQNTPVEARPEPTLVRMLPFAVDNFERNVLVGGTGLEDDSRDLRLVLVLDDAIRWSLLRIDEIRVEDARERKCQTRRSDKLGEG